MLILKIILWICLVLLYLFVGGIVASIVSNDSAFLLTIVIWPIVVAILIIIAVPFAIFKVLQKIIKTIIHKLRRK